MRLAVRGEARASGRIDLWCRLLMVGLTLAGFAARIRALGGKSLWLDEGLSVNMAGTPLRSLLGLLVEQDIHPPLHYLILHFWMALAGRTEFAVRFPALVAGLALVPATYALALALFGAGRGRSPLAAYLTALLSAALVAGSPFLVYYSQEARMYSDLVLWGLLSSLTLWKALGALDRRLAERSASGSPRARSATWWLVAYAASTALALYTHYFAGFVVAFQAVYVLLLALRRPRIGLAWLLAAGGAGLAYLPWVYGVVSQMHRLATSPDFWKGELSLGFIVEKVFTALALGKSGVPVQSAPLIAVAVLLFGAGLILLLRQGLGGRRADLYALAYLVVPLLALYAISARNPKFTERYLIVIAPVFYLIVARTLVSLGQAGQRLRADIPSIVWGGRLIAVAATTLALGASAVELQRVYWGPGYEKDDNRSAIAYIEQHEQPGDVVVLMMDTSHVFKYYYRGALPYYGLHPGDDVVHAADRLNQYLAGKRRLWLLLWQEDWADPTGFTRDSLDANLTRLPGPGEYRGLKLILYAVDRPTFSADLKPSQSSPVNFEGALTFLGYDPPAKRVTAGDRADLTLYWQAARALAEDYVVSARLRADGFTWARHDQRPAAETYPTPYWKVGRTVMGRLALPIPPGTPPGEYEVELVVYSREARRDLSVLDAEGRPIAPRAVVGKLTVERPPTPVDPASVTVQRPFDARFGEDLRLFGVDLGGEAVRPGATVDLALYWQALGRARGDDLVALSLLDAAGQTHSLAERRPVAGRYATAGWAEGEVVVDRYRLVVPPEAAPGPASLRLAVRRLPDLTPLPSAGEPVVLATLQVGERPRIGERPADVQHSLDLRVGDVGRLIGYSLSPDRPRPGGELRLTLYWEASGSSPASYAVFTHLLDGQSVIWGQHDGEPGGGANPTTGWLAGEYVRDEHRLPVKPDAPAGEYELEVGMYDPQTGARLPVFDGQGHPAGDRIVLQTVTLDE